MAQLESPELVGKRVSLSEGGVPAGIKAMKDQAARIETQKKLVIVIAQWAGFQRLRGMSDRSIHKKFYLAFDMTISEALSQKKAEMLYLMETLEGELENERRWRK
jgi:hypothetical protein